MNPEDRLEDDVCGYFRDIGLSAKKTKDSGAARGDGDVLGGEHFMAECKYKSTEGFGISKKDFEKAEQQARKQGRDPVFFTRNVDGRTVVTVSAEVWIKWMLCAVARVQE